MALKDKKIPAGRKVDPALAEAIRARLIDGTVGCSAAFTLAQEKGVSPLALGEAADSLGIRLSHCQLGLFGFPGYAKAWEIPGWKDVGASRDVEDAVRSALDPDGSLSCAAAWAVADRFGIARAHIGHFASRLDVKIKKCQLGAF
jgi:hypothetical protein